MDEKIEQTEVEETTEYEIGSYYGMNEGTIDFLDLPVDIVYILFDQFDNIDLMS